jgi:hypothetical protein
VAGRRRALGAAARHVAGDEVRHRDQIHRLRHTGAVAGLTEARERGLVVRERGRRLLEVDVPVRDTVQAPRLAHGIAQLAREGERGAATGAALGVVARRPQHA